MRYLKKYFNFNFNLEKLGILKLHIFSDNLALNYNTKLYIKMSKLPNFQQLSLYRIK